ncbi:MFS transporter [Pikeienuella piscinae]|uniref:MFS transporter n=2 Tax=Pikeienuella piscinae TaxID=2748098 RepID=A0A7M3T7H0_9RHOB|nr:MFS transporter [Pikeienuella piscinae]
MSLAEGRALPRWRRPESMLILMAFGSMLAFSTWMAVAANFIIEVVHFDGSDNGWMHTVREIPGFLAFLAIFIFALIKEQTFGLISLFLLGFGSALTAEFPTLQGVLVVTFISSLGFHYFETVAQSLQLQWLPKAEAPRILGRIVSAASAGALVSYGSIVLAWEFFDLSYRTIYWASGGFCMAVALVCWLAYPQFRSDTVQRKDFVVKRRYWLYYALVFMAGARRQIFTVFAAFMMVELYGFHLHHVAGLMLLNYCVMIFAAPLIGRVIARRGERLALIVEYSGLLTVFLFYAGLYWFAWPWEAAAALYVVDHILFTMAFAQKTYFQKIADPEDQAPTAAVAFTINHIAAVFLPALLGYLWLVDPASVYSLAAAMACVSLFLATLVPRHPEKGRETRLARGPLAQPAE